MILFKIILTLLFHTTYLLPLSSQNPQCLAPKSYTIQLYDDLCDYYYSIEDVSFGLMNLNNEWDKTRLKKLLQQNEDYPEMIINYLLSLKDDETTSPLQQLQQRCKDFQSSPNNRNSAMMIEFTTDILSKTSYCFFVRDATEPRGDFLTILPIFDFGIASVDPNNLAKRNFHMLPPMEANQSEAFKYNPELFQKMKRVLIAQGMLSLSMLSAPFKGEQIGLTVAASDLSDIATFLNDFELTESPGENMITTSIQNTFPAQILTASSDSVALINTEKSPIQKSVFLLDSKTNSLVMVNGIKKALLSGDELSDLFEESEAEASNNDILNVKFYSKDNYSLTGENLQKKLGAASKTYSAKFAPVNFDSLVVIETPSKLREAMLHTQNWNTVFSKEKTNNNAIVEVKGKTGIKKFYYSLKNNNKPSFPIAAYRWLEGGYMQDASFETSENLVGLLSTIIATSEGGKIYSNIVSSAEGLMEFLSNFLSSPTSQQFHPTSFRDMLEQSQNSVPESVENTIYDSFFNRVFSTIEANSLSVAIVEKYQAPHTYDQLIDEIYDLMRKNNYWFTKYPEVPTVHEGNKHLLPQSVLDSGEYTLLSYDAWKFMNDFLGCPLQEGKSIVLNPLRRMVENTLFNTNEREYLVLSGKLKGEEKPRVLVANVIQLYYEWGEQFTGSLARKHYIFSKGLKDEAELDLQIKANPSILNEIQTIKDQMRYTVFGGQIVSDKKLSGVALFNMILTFLKSATAGFHPGTGDAITFGSTGAGNPANDQFTSGIVSMLLTICSKFNMPNLPHYEFTDPVPQNSYFPFSEVKTQEFADEVQLSNGETVWVNFNQGALDYFSDKSNIVSASILNKENHILTITHKTHGISVVYKLSDAQYKEAMRYFSKLLAVAMLGIKDKEGKRHPIKGLKSLLQKMFINYRVLGDSRSSHPFLDLFARLIGQAIPHILEGKPLGAREPFYKRFQRIQDASPLTSVGFDEKPILIQKSINTDSVLSEISTHKEPADFGIFFGIGGLFNLDLIWSRKSNGAYITDKNMNVMKIWDILSNHITKENPDDFSDPVYRKEWLEKMITDIKSFLASKNYSLEEYESQFDELRKNADDSWSWLGSKESFRFMKELFDQKRIAWKILDLGNKEDLKNFAFATKAENVSIDTMNIGNALSILDSDEAKEYLGNFLTQITHAKTLIVENHGTLLSVNSSQNHPFIESNSQKLMLQTKSQLQIAA